MDKLQNVLFVIDTLATGGAEKSLLEITSCFHRYKPVVCYIYHEDSLRKEYEARGIKVVPLEIKGRYNFLNAAKALQNVIDAIKPVVIHSTLFRSDVICRMLRKKNGVLLINSLVNNSYHPLRFKKGSLTMRFKLRVIQAIDSYTAGRVDLFLSNSNAIKVTNAGTLGIRPDKIKVIYRGRDHQSFEHITAESCRQLKAELGVAESKVLLNVSRLLERKGQSDLIRAFSKMKDTSTVLLIAGEGPYHSYLQKEIADLGLSSRVRLLGNRDDVATLLSMADCFVFPSYFEGLPGALIEAMMSGIPIVASAIPENLECVDNESATLFAPGNIEELARAIMEVLNRSDSIIAKSKNARSIALKKFDINVISSMYENLYDQMLKAE